MSAYTELEKLHNECRRLGDAIFCLSDISAHPEMVEILKADLAMAAECFREKERELAEAPKQKKKPIPVRVRIAVFIRDKFTCQKCGQNDNLSVDHIYPESLGGKAIMENLQTLCRPCNSKKGAKVAV